MGAAGDMLASALVDLFDDKEAIIRELNSLNLPDTVIEYSRVSQNSIGASHLSIIIRGEEEKGDDSSHHHSHGRHLSDIYKIIDTLNVSDEVKSDVKSVYSAISQAEARVHGKEAGEVHFHELGMLDAIADITLTSYLIRKLKPSEILCSPINVGNGTVKCAHGELPVPAPATAEILTGVPYYKSNVFFELCTPTGAALLKCFADKFTDEPQLTSVVKTGIGAGTKQFERANILRAFLFEDKAKITELSCNIDDMTGEEAAFAAERIMENGALDCFFMPILMKKGRPAYIFTVICKQKDEEKFTALIFKHTTTIGIRKYTPSRYTLDREFSDEGAVRIKRSSGFGTVKVKAEFEDLKALALERDISIFEAKEIINNKNTGGN